MDALVVSVRLDALVLEREVDVVEGAADFSRLPYVDSHGRDREAGSPYLSEQILPIPFQDGNMRLKSGVHLHWTLPDALTRLVQRDGETAVRVVPNRWLVTRTTNGVVERQWVVESDFLAPVGGEGG